jgi:hypothetical protein
MVRSSLTYILGFSVTFFFQPLTLKQQWTIKISSPLFSILSLAAILVGSRDHRTQFWKGATQESFQQSLVEFGSVVSEEKMFLNFIPPFF